MGPFTIRRETIGQSPVRSRSPHSVSLRQGRKNRDSPLQTMGAAAYQFFFTVGSSPLRGLIQEDKRRAIPVYFLTALGAFARVEKFWKNTTYEQKNGASIFHMVVHDRCSVDALGPDGPGRSSRLMGRHSAFRGDECVRLFWYNAHRRGITCRVCRINYESHSITSEDAEIGHKRRPRTVQSLNAEQRT